tara:strand:- start:1552 stop:1806 length:255 start_codon:yes stop_codon:yes gene_type:complete
MNYYKIFCSIIFIIFFSLIINNYFSDSFLIKKKLARQNYNLFLKKEINKINIIKSKKNFKKFQDNSKYFKTNEEREFWKLLRTK